MARFISDNLVTFVAITAGLGASDKNAGIRIIYKLLKIDEKLIIVIGARADDEVYKIAENRVNKK